MNRSGWCGPAEGRIFVKQGSLECGAFLVSLNKYQLLDTLSCI